MFHPSGSLGKKLLLKVEDLYHSDKEFPYVNENSLISDAVISISEKGFGCTIIIDNDKNLKGIITDGDIRRGVEKFKDIFSMNVMEIASKSPKTINKDALAAKALAIMEEHSITSIVVVDDNNKPEGIIHMHDIIKAGII